MISIYKTDWVKHVDHFFHHCYLQNETYGDIYFTVKTKGRSKKCKIRTIRTEKERDGELMGYLNREIRKASDLFREKIKEFEPNVKAKLKEIALVEYYPGEPRVKGRALYPMPGHRIVFELIQTEEKREIQLNVKKNQLERISPYLYPGWKNELKTHAANFLQSEVNECKTCASFDASVLEEGMKLA